MRAAGSGAFWKRRMAAIPAAPAEMQEEKFSTVMPPMASTGIVRERETCSRAERPCGGPKEIFDGVAKTGPKKM